VPFGAMQCRPQNTSSAGFLKSLQRSSHGQPLTSMRHLLQPEANTIGQQGTSNAKIKACLQICMDLGPWALPDRPMGLGPKSPQGAFFGGPIFWKCFPAPDSERLPTKLIHSETRFPVPQSERLPQWWTFFWRCLPVPQSERLPQN